jgi:hypothetical protein
VGIPAGQFITATSTNEKLQTSELSNCQVVTAAAIVVTAPPGGLTTTEAGGTATFTVKLATAPVADVTIGLTSSKPTEATVSPASLRFTSTDGTVEQTVTVTGVADSVADGNQAFAIVLAPASSMDPAYAGMKAPDVNGLNQDGPTLPTLSIQAAATATESTGNNVPIIFNVTLSPSSTQTVTVGWEVIDGTAKVGPDIQSSDRLGILTFGAGETAKSIALQVVGDALVEGTENFTIRLVGATNAVIGFSTGSGTILDNDPGSAGSCSPRPPIAMTVLRTGTDQLNVTLTAGSGTISKISFGSEGQPIQNALIETIGPAGIIEGFGTFTPPAGVTQQSFVVRRLAANLPVTVRIVVEDACGPWTTFVGAGQAAF